MIATPNDPENYFHPISVLDSSETHPIQINEDLSKKYFNIDNSIFSLYYPKGSDTAAIELSKEERKQKKLTDECYTYGEITFRAFSYIYEYIKSHYHDQIIDGNFYDLGSGAGKGVISAALCHPFKNCIGIEILDSLYNNSIDIKEKFENNIQSQIKDLDYLFDNKNIFPNLKFIHGDFFNEKLDNPSIVYITTTCFSDELLYKVADKFNKECVKGTIVISLSTKILGLNEDWEYLNQFKMMFSWGMPSVFIQRKKQ